MAALARSACLLLLATSVYCAASQPGLRGITSEPAEPTSSTLLASSTDVDASHAQLVTTSFPSLVGNGTAPTIDGHTLPDWFATASSAGMIGIGLVEVFFGYKLFRVTLFMLGGVAAGVPTFLVAWDNIQDPNAVWMGLGFGIMSGLLAGIASFYLYKLGVFLCGAALGVVSALVLNMAVLYKLGFNNIPFIVAAVVLGLAFGGLGFYFMRTTMVTATAVVGAYACIRGIGYFGGGYPSNEFDVEQELQNGHSDQIPMIVYGYFGGWVVLWILGLFVQFKYTAKKGKTDEKDEWEKAYDESRLDLEAITGKRRKGKKKGKKGSKKSSSGGGGKNKSKSGRQAKADALLSEYDDSGEYYDGYDDQYGYDESGQYYDEAGYGDGYAANSNAGGKKGWMASLGVGSKSNGAAASGAGSINGGGGGRAPASGKKGGKGKVPQSVDW